MHYIFIPVTSTITANPEDESIVTLSQEISSVDASIIVCNPAEQASLTTGAKELEDAAEVITTNLSEVLGKLNGRN